MTVIKNSFDEKPYPDKEENHHDIVWARVDSVVNLILENDRWMQSKRGAELTKAVMEKFSLSERQSQRYIQAAKKEIRKLAAKNKDAAFIQEIRDREYLIMKCRGSKNQNGKYTEKPDYKLMFQIMQDRADLHGLYEQKVTHSGKIDLRGDDLKRLSDEQLELLKGKIIKGEDPIPFLLSLGIDVKYTS